MCSKQEQRINVYFLLHITAVRQKILTSILIYHKYTAAGTHLFLLILCWKNYVSRSLYDRKCPLQYSQKLKYIDSCSVLDMNLILKILFRKIGAPPTILRWKERIKIYYKSR